MKLTDIVNERFNQKEGSKKMKTTKSYNEEITIFPHVKNGIVDSGLVITIKDASTASVCGVKYTPEKLGELIEALTYTVDKMKELAAGSS